MNPLTHFEQAARKIWTSGFGPEQKAMQLSDLGNRISNYVAQLEDLPAEGDAWMAASMERARKYLLNLASDMHHLAIQCKQP